MSNGAITVAWIVGLVLLTWFLFIRPRRAMVARQRQVLGALSAGDQVVTVGGIY
ncbi:MAG: Preprotein translocase subunit, partial [Gaiellales bacterium]|nr:Preprotein translocase subunit [Gaiellales bacterium]